MSAPYPDKAEEAGYPPQQPYPAPPAQQGGYGYAPVAMSDQPAYPPTVKQDGYPAQEPQVPPYQPSPYQPAPYQLSPYQQQPQAYGVQGQPLVIECVPQPGYMLRQTQPQPADYLPLAIFVTVCCCLPFGIVGIVKSTEVRNRYVVGDMDGARESSLSAKKWSIAGLVSGILIQVVLYGFMIAYYAFVFPTFLN